MNQEVTLPELSDAEYFAAMKARSNIRELQLAQIFPGVENQAVEIGAIDPDTGHLNHVDMLYVCAIARQVAARRIFEFGTYLGRTTYHLATSAHRPEVFTLDLDPAADNSSKLKLGAAVSNVHKRDLQGVFFRGKPEAARIRQLHGDCRTFDYSAFERSMDLIFIDGGHSYEFIKNDTEKAFGMLRPGGVVIWHDFAPKSRDVVTFAYEFSQKVPLFWVSKTSLLVHVDGVDPVSFEARVEGHARERIKPKQTP